MIGIIGGTGLYKIDGVSNLEKVSVNTPFGLPSSDIQIGLLNKVKVAFLARHGEKHEQLPSEINYRANIWALKSVGVRRILSVSAVGSLKEEIRPGDLAMPSQYFDWTRGKRVGTFFGEGLVAHVSTAEPSCPSIQQELKAVAASMDMNIHSGLTYACVEGPRLGSRAESHFLRNNGCDLVGMTNVPEAFLAREAQLCYCTIAVATDYDCWLEDPSQHAEVDKVIELYRKNIGRVQNLIEKYVSLAKSTTTCGCRTALKYAVLSDENILSEQQKTRLNFLRE